MPGEAAGQMIERWPNAPGPLHRPRSARAASWRSAASGDRNEAPKASNQMNDPEVLAKRDAALDWCRHATGHASSYGGKPWRYALIPHDAIAENMTPVGLLNPPSSRQNAEPLDPVSTNPGEGQSVPPLDVMRVFCPMVSSPVRREMARAEYLRDLARFYEE